MSDYEACMYEESVRTTTSFEDISNENARRKYYSNSSNEHYLRSAFYVPAAEPQKDTAVL